MVNTDRLCRGCMNDNGGEKICSICGYDSSEDNASEFLAVGTWLNANRYLLGRVIEESGDGVTYIGWDNEINAVVNIKEYFPQGIAVRRPDRLTVTPDEDKALAFTRGINSFTDLFFKLRNQPESTAILRVVDIFEANGTMYAVQNTVSGTTLKSFLIRNGGTLKWEQVKPLFMPLLATISDLNSAGIVHRGISPDNIIVGRDGKLRLSGFCIKEVKVEHTEFLSYLASGYAAPEQYLENDTYSDSCDVYAIGAVMFRTLIGVTPPDAKDRLVNDRLSVPAKVTEVVPKGALVSIANTLKVDKTERVSSVERFYKMLETVSVGTAVVPSVAAKETAPKKQGLSGKNAAIIASAVTAVIFIILFIIFWILFGHLLTPNQDNSSTSDPSPIITDTSSVNSGYAPEGGTYPIPELVGKVYTDVYGEMQTEYSQFKFEVGGRIPSDKYPRGSICEIKVNGIVAKAGDKAPRDTVIEIYISQGPDKVTMPNIIGQSVDEAKSMLFDAGFYSDTIILRKAYDEFILPGQVFKVTYGEDDASIVAGTKVSLNELIIVYYREEEETGTDSGAVTE
ncbi:MAG: PASTA domain-containing protein [Ruminococcaceae bacterium]|nr:PASTA domain-containing protein [Oscillospiraceae bacterium]